MLNKLQKKKLACEAVERLEQIYPQAVCSLEYSKPYELLIAVRLSAQCTDARVNIVTKVLFEKYPTLESIANADIVDIENIVKPCGLYKTKAKSIVDTAKKLISEFDSKIPDNMDALLSLPGIGRKSANLILGDIYGQTAVVTDTHCMRICERLGLSKGREPYAVEMQLREILPMDKANDFCHRLVLFGREYCSAKKPKCTSCPVADICSYKEKTK